MLSNQGGIARIVPWPLILNRSHIAARRVGAGGAAVQTYAEKVLGYSPIAYWMQAEASGTDALCEVDSNQDGTYTGVTLGQTGIGDGNTSPYYDGVNDRTNIYTTTFRDAFDGSAGTAMIWCKVVNSGIWTDNAYHWIAELRADSSNTVQLVKMNDNTIGWGYNAGGTSKAVFLAETPTDWFHIAFTWDKNADEVKAYFNGSQTGSTLTGLGTWAGTFDSDWTVIGTLSAGSTYIWDGWLAHCAVWTSALTPADIADLAVV